MIDEVMRRVAALHESAHVAALHSLKRQVLDVVLGDCARRWGVTRWHRGDMAPEDEIFVACAGIAAEVRLFGLGVIDVASRAEGGDLASIAALWAVLDDEAAVDRAACRAERLVAENWDMIVALATLLMERGRLTGDEAFKVLRRCDG